MQFFLIRHGETDWNKQFLLQGREDIPLNEDGIAQAHVTGKALSNTHVDLILSSPLSRAFNTAKIIASYTNNPKIIIEENLIERDFGKLSGLCYKGRNVFAGFEGDDEAEPLEKVTQRIFSVLNKYAQEADEKYHRIVVVAHGAILRTVKDALGNLEPMKLGNGAVSVINYSQGKYTLGPLNVMGDDIALLK